MSNKSNKLDLVKSVIEVNIFQGSCGIFNTRNTIGDEMKTILDTNGVRVDICFEHEYFEVFGLTESEFNRIKRYYWRLIAKCNPWQ